MSLVRNPRDFFAGVLLLTLAALFTWSSLQSKLGSLERFGPGFFPLVLAVILGVLGFFVVVSSLRVRGEMPSVAGWRGAALVVISIFVFGLALEPLGAVVALPAAVFISTLASRRFHLGNALLLTFAITFFCWTVFIYGLGQTMPVIGPWLGGN
jgi:hypothetical protein